MGIRIQGLSGSADVDSHGNLRVMLPQNITQSGYATMVAESDDGDILGNETYRLLEASQDFRLRVGSDSLLHDDTFNYAIFNTYVYQHSGSVMSASVGGGFLTLNTGSSVTTGQGIRVSSYKNFPTFGTYPLYVEMWLGFSAAFQANSFHEFGLGYAPSLISAPVDFVGFRVSGTNLLGVLNNNGAESTTTLNFAPDLNTIHHYIITIHNEKTEFWIDDILYGLVTTSPGLTGPTLAPSLPWLFRQYNNGAVGNPIQTKLGRLTVSQGDLINNRLWPTQMVGMGQGGYASPHGSSSVGSTANVVNSATPANAVLSNTVADYTSLGGQFAITGGKFTPAETDYALFAYNVPVGSAVVPGKSLMVRGIRIESALSGAASVLSQSAGPILMQWGLGLGSTAVSLATVDATGSATRAPRRIALGMQTFASASQIGTLAPNLCTNFDVPLTVEPGTFFHVTLKIPVGTVTSGAYAVRGTVFVNSYFE